MRQWVIRHPFATYGVIVLLLRSLIYALRLQYDDGGLGTLLFVTEPIWGVVYWAPRELLFALNGGRAFVGQGVIAVALGGMVCILADHVLFKRRKRHSDLTG